MRMVEKFLPLLAEPFIVPPNRPDLTPLRDLMADSYPSTFDHETTLTERLDTTVFMDLDRVLRVLALHPKYPNGCSPVYTDVGSNGYLRPGMQGTAYRPDRCTRTNETTIGGVTRCPGDIKCSYKFQGSWAQSMDAPLAAKGARALGQEFQKVMAQLQWYMQDIGINPELDLGAKFGYIITDSGVTLVMRDEVSGRRGLKVELFVTEEFPLRDARPGQINGMLALLLIHLLASNPQYLCLKD
jgi:hypothetical protein